MSDRRIFIDQRVELTGDELRDSDFDGCVVVLRTSGIRIARARFRNCHFEGELAEWVNRYIAEHPECTAPIVFPWDETPPTPIWLPRRASPGAT